MTDIFLGLAIMSLLAGLCFSIFLRIGRKLGHPRSKLLALTVVLGIFTYAFLFWYNPRLTWILPVSNLVILGNWFPLACGALGGVAWNCIPGKVFRKSLFVGGLTVAAAYSMSYPLLGSGPACGDVWSKNVCIQTTPMTCTPACAATLLRAHGITTSESEMTEACLTRHGTTWMGLYRGLKLKTRGTNWDVEVLTCSPDELASIRGPLILSVGLPWHHTQGERRKMTEWGWKPGIGHSVILMRRAPNGRFVIADPTPGCGREDWSRHDLEYLYRGMAVRLVKRY